MEIETAMDYQTAAKYIGCSSSALRQWKRLGKGPSYYKLGKLVRYRKADLDNWLALRLMAMNETASN